MNEQIFASALREADWSHGLETAERDVTAIRTTDGRVTGAETADRTQIDSERVVVAGAAWSSAFGDDLGVEIPSNRNADR